MFRIESARESPRYCDGLSRRSFLQVGVAGLGSVTLADVLRAKAESAASGFGKKNTRAILIWLDGGPSHLDLYDLKPEAPAEYRGIWRPVHTNVAGIEISELFPLQARIADKFSIVRSLHHDSGDHFTAGHYMLTGRGGPSGANTAGKNPSIGSVIERVRGACRPGMPGYVAVPRAMSIGLRPGYFGANYLGIQHNPFETEGDPNRAGFEVRNLKLSAGLDIDRLEDRRSLLGHLDTLRRDVDRSGAFDVLDRFHREAYELVSGPAARRAFDLSSEDPRLRDRYGRTHWGQCALLARRLVESGVTFVTAHLGGWDHHWNLKAGMESLLPRVDRLVSALFEDLEARGLLDDVLVIVCGEFSRTPRMNNGSGQGTPGRDHWGNAMFCVVGGGGVQGGRIVGATDRRGEYVVERPVTPADLHATIYHVLGVDPGLQFLNHSGRPVPIVDHGSVIEELL